MGTLHFGFEEGLTHDSDAFVNCPSYFIAKSVASADQKAYKMVFNAGSQFHAATAPFLFSLDYASESSLVSPSL